MESRRCLHSGGPDGVEWFSQVPGVESWRCLHSGGPDGAEWFSEVPGAVHAVDKGEKPDKDVLHAPLGCC